ncbi:hypothetical protein [Paenarthrobacter sp. TE4293]|uniref:hypothetical protein n=1 Tax=Paenarthrobacter sp. TE4293 TaxID=3381695 RepID=UPI003D1E3349
MSKLLERTDVAGITGMSFSGKPGTSAFTVAVAPGAGVADAVDAAVPAADAELEPVGDDDADDGDEESVGEGAAEPPGDGVHAEAATATLTASRANPRDRGVPKTFTGDPSGGWA